MQDILRSKDVLFLLIPCAIINATEVNTLDLTNINPDHIDMFGSCYNLVSYINDVEPVCSSANTKNKIRKWFTKHYIKNESLPDDIMKYVGKGVSDDDFILFLKACKDQLKIKGNKERQKLDSSFTDLSFEIKDALWSLLSVELYPLSIKQIGTDLYVTLDDAQSYTHKLILHNATPIDLNFDYITFEENPLIKTVTGYKLHAVAHSFENIDETLYTVSFDNASTDIQVYNAACAFEQTPWETLQQIAYHILSKLSIPGDHLNEAEKQLLPLIAEIGKLYICPSLPEEYKNSGFPRLRSYIEKYQYTELLPSLDKFEKNFHNATKKSRCRNKLFSKLNEYRYKPLWDEIHGLLCATQELYPNKSDLNTQLASIRDKIHERLTFLGYQGTYPNYEKSGKINGIRMVESYDMSYIIAAEKNGISHIHCAETFDDNLKMQFLCGTELLKKGQLTTDIYSCMFNCKGRKLYDYVNCAFGYYNSEEEIVDDDLEKRVLIATKIAELKKLTKEERNEVGAISFADKLKLFIIMYIIIGGAFSLLFIGIFIIFGILLCLLFLSPHDIPSLFTDIPWLWFFAFCWILYGGAMAYITVSGKRK